MLVVSSRKSTEGRDSGTLRSINVLGSSYKFTEKLTAAAYASDVENVLKKQYVNANYVFPIDQNKSLTLDFNGYCTKLMVSTFAKASPMATRTRFGLWPPPTPEVRARSQ